MSELENVLEKIGFSDHELKVYQAIIAFGFRTKGQIVSYTQLSYEGVEQACNSLIEKNYLKKIINKSEEAAVYIPLAPKIAISGEVSQNLSNRLKELSNNVSDLWDTTQTTIDGDTEKLIQTTEISLNEILDFFDRKSGEYQESITQISENFKEKVVSSTNDASIAFQNRINQPLTSLSVQLSNLAKKIEDLCDSSIGTIEEASETHKESLMESANQINNEIEEFLESVGMFTGGRISGLSQQIEDSSLTATEKSEKAVGNLHSGADELIDANSKVIEEIDKTLSNEFLNNYEVQLGNITNNLQQSQSQFETLIAEAEQSGTTAKSTIVSGAKELIVTMDKAQKTKITTLEKNLLNSIKTVQSKAVSQLSEVLRGTGKDLTTLYNEMVKNLTTNESKLSTDLNNLQVNLGKNLSNRFSDVKIKLKEFVDTLKGSSMENVSEIISSVIDLKNFILDFLINTKESLNSEYDALKTSVKSNIENIVKETTQRIDAINNQNTEEVNKLHSTITDNLNEFQNKINSLLNNIKNDLQKDLIAAQGNFKDGVNKGIEAYQQESAKRQEEQKEQLQSIQEESNELTSIAMKSRSDLLGVVENDLNEKKDEVISNLNEVITNSVEKFSREFTRFNEKLERALQDFYEDFNDSSTGLRDDVPQEVEKLLIDQSDRLEDFRRDFDRNMGHANDLLNHLDQTFKTKKKLGKKDVEELDEQLTRTIADFQYFEQSISNHFNTSIEDTESIKNELLNKVNKTIQDELISLEDLVKRKSDENKSLSNDLLENLTGNSTEYINNLSTGIEESVNDLESSIKKDLISKFEQPLESILSKAKYIATGSEGADQENRLIRTQNILIENLQGEVEKLVEALQSVFNTSITSVDTKVEDAISNAESILSELRSSLENTFSDQKSSVSSISDEFKTSLTTAEKSLNSALSNSLSSSIENVSNTVDEQSAEVEKTVTDRTNLINDSTNSSLEQMDVSLSEFNTDFDTILATTKSEVSDMVKSSTKIQKSNLTSSTKQLKATLDKAQNTLKTTHQSLNENVDKELKLVEASAKSLVKDYTTTLLESEKTIIADIDKHFESALKHINALNGLKQKLATSTAASIKDIKSTGKIVKKNLDSELVKHLKSRKANLSGFQGKLKETINEISEINSSLLIEMFDMVNTQLSVLQGEINEYVLGAKGSVNDTVTNAVENVRMDILSASNSVSNTLSEEKTNSPVKIREIVNLVDSLDGVQENEFTSSKDELIKTINDNVNNSKEVWIGNGTQTFKTQQTAIDKLSSEFKSKIESHSSSGKKSVSKALQTIPTTIEETLDAAAKSMTLLNEISKGSVALDPKFPELSYFDYSKEGIMANLNGVLSRTKSSVIIVSPSIAWLSEDLIPGFARVSLKIITDVDNATPEEKKIISRIQDSGVNLDLRKIDRNRFRGEINMIMASRDKEEVILAKLLDSNEPYAFVSQDEDFINKFTDLFTPFQTMPRAT